MLGTITGSAGSEVVFVDELAGFWEEDELTGGFEADELAGGFGAEELAGALSEADELTGGSATAALDDALLSDDETGSAELSGFSELAVELVTDDTSAFELVSSPNADEELIELTPSPLISDEVTEFPDLPHAVLIIIDVTARSDAKIFLIFIQTAPFRIYIFIISS